MIGKMRKWLCIEKNYYKPTISSKAKLKPSNSKGQTIIKTDSNKISNIRTDDSQQNKLVLRGTHQKNVNNPSKNKTKCDANTSKKMTDKSNDRRVSSGIVMSTYQADYVDHTGEARSRGNIAHVKETVSFMKEPISQLPNPKSKSTGAKHIDTMTESNKKMTDKSNDRRVSSGKVMSTYQADYVDHTGEAKSRGNIANDKKTASFMKEPVSQLPNPKSKSTGARYIDTLTQSIPNHMPQNNRISPKLNHKTVQVVVKSHKNDDIIEYSIDHRNRKSKSPRMKEQLPISNRPKYQYNSNNYNPTSTKPSNITDQVHHITNNKKPIYSQLVNEKWARDSSRNGRISPTHKIFDNQEQNQIEDQFDGNMYEYSMARSDQTKRNMPDSTSRKFNNFPTRYRKLLNTQYEGTDIDNLIIVDKINKLEEEIANVVSPDRILVRSGKKISCHTSPQNIKSTNVYRGGHVIDLSAIVPHNQCHTHDDGEAWEYNNPFYNTNVLDQDQYSHEIMQCNDLSNIVKEFGLEVECLSHYIGHDLPQSGQIISHKTDKLISQRNKEFATYQDKEITTDSSRVKHRNHRYLNDDEEVWKKNKVSCKVGDNQREKSKMKNKSGANDIEFAKSKDKSQLSNMKHNLKHDRHNIELHHFDRPESPQIVGDKERILPKTNHKIILRDNSTNYPLFIPDDQSELSSYDNRQKHLKSRIKNKSDVYDIEYPKSKDKSNLSNMELNLKHDRQEYLKSSINSDKENDNENPNSLITQFDRDQNLMNEKKRNEVLNNYSHTVNNVSQARHTDVDINSKKDRAHQQLKNKNISSSNKAAVLNSNAISTNIDQEIVFPRSTVKSVSQNGPMAPIIVTNNKENEHKLNKDYKVDKIVTNEDDNSFTTSKFQNEKHFLNNKRNVEQLNLSLNDTKAASHEKPIEFNHVDLSEISQTILNNGKNYNIATMIPTNDNFTVKYEREENEKRIPLNVIKHQIMQNDKGNASKTQDENFTVDSRYSFQKPDQKKFVNRLEEENISSSDCITKPVLQSEWPSDKNIEHSNLPLMNEDIIKNVPFPDEIIDIKVALNHMNSACSPTERSEYRNDRNHKKLSKILIDNVNEKSEYFSAQNNQNSSNSQSETEEIQCLNYSIKPKEQIKSINTYNVDGTDDNDQIIQDNHTLRGLSAQSQMIPNFFEKQRTDKKPLAELPIQVFPEKTGEFNRNIGENNCLDINVHYDKTESNIETRNNTDILEEKKTILSIIKKTDDKNISMSKSTPPQDNCLQSEVRHLEHATNITNTMHESDPRNDSTNERCDSVLSYFSNESSLNFSAGEKSGFKNTQGYCFLNSVLQVLRGCKSFNKALIRYHNESRILNSQGSDENKVFITKFCKLMNDLKENCNVEDCVEYIQNFFQSSSTGDDVNKCFMNLLTVINNVTREPQPKGTISNDAESKFKAFRKANYGFVFDCFFGQMEHRMTCETCQKSINRKYQLFKCLPLHVPISESKVPLLKSIEMFFQKTKVEIDDPMKCDCVNGTVNISSQCQITHSPKYLFIYLDRGSLIVGGEKKSTFITTDESLLINTTRGPRHYNLISVIDHIGTNENGHYYCKCNYETDNWWLLNDTQVQNLGRCNIKTIVSKNSIVYVFRKRKGHI